MLKCKPGAGLRPAHYLFYDQNLLSKANADNEKSIISWFEVITENYMDSFSPARTRLFNLRKNYPIAIHGVGLNIASSEGLDTNYLHKLKNFVNEIEPFEVSDHLCWTGLKNGNIHDLLPIPYTSEMLSFVCDQVDQVQNTIGRQISLENASSYFSYKNSEMTEWEFFNEMMSRTNCKMLLDINNVFVSASNNGFDPYTYISKIDPKNVGQIHLAGFTDMGNYLFDTHSKPVFSAVWNLFSKYIENASEVPFMIEWDDDIPEFREFEAEIKKAVAIWEHHHGTQIREESFEASL